MTTIKEVSELLKSAQTLSDPLFEHWSQDTRQGVQKLINKRQRDIQAALDEAARLDNLLAYERQLYTQNISLIAGIDEVGRGPLAGPVVTAHVILPENCKIPGLNDSKQIPKAHHQVVYDRVMAESLAVWHWHY